MGRDATIVPLFGASTKGPSRTVTSQRRINLYTDIPNDAEKSKLVFYARPGLRYRWYLGGTGPQIVRGMFDSFPYTTAIDGIRAYSYAVSGDRISIIALGTVGNIGNTLTETGNVDGCLGSTQFLLIDGRTGYVIDLATNNVTTIEGSGLAAWFPPGATSCCWIGGRFVAVKPNTGQFFHSDLNAALTGSALNFYTAESDPDDLRVVWNHQGQLAAMGQYTTEFWSLGSGTVAFQRVGGTTIEWGIAAPYSLRRTDVGSMFIGRNRNGQTKVLRMQGYAVEPVSNPDVEYTIQSYPIEQAIGSSYSFNGHTFYRLAWPDIVWCYDTKSGIWHEEQTGALGARAMLNRTAIVDSEIFGADYNTQNVYIVDPEALTDNGEIIPREIVTRHTYHDVDPITIDDVTVQFQTGVGLVEGQGADPKAMMQTSIDNGATWGSELWESMGKLGDYLAQCWWGPLGSARDWLFRLRVTDPVKTVITFGAINVRR